MTEARSVAGVVVVISGATRGLGRSTARHLAARGASIALCARSDEDARVTADEIRQAYSVAAYGCGVDVSDARSAQHFASNVADALGPADVLINNAAVLGPVGPLGDDSLADWSRTIGINVSGVANMTAAFRSQLARSRAGRVINLSGGGVGGPAPMQSASAYVTSKYAITGLTEALASDLATDGITINAIAPGAIPTTFLDGVVAAGPELVGQTLFDDAARRRQTVDRSAAEDAAAEPFAALVEYLMSVESSWLSGRLLSARWETADRLRRESSRMTDAQYRLRRIDHDLFSEQSA